MQQDRFYSIGLEGHVDTYLELVWERYNALKVEGFDPVIFIEQRVDFSNIVPEGFGTCDCVIIGDGGRVLEIIDLKFGKGVPVFAESNTQMMLYALGALNEFGCVYEPSMVRMTICQPRLDNVSTSEISVDELIIFGESYIKPRAQMAWAGEGEFVPGEHCRFCRVKATCRARAEMALELTKYDFKQPELLEVGEIAVILEQADELRKWAEDIQEYAFAEAHYHGVKFPGWKLVEGRSNRKYTNPAAVVEKLKSAGFDEEKLFEKEILGITAMEKVVTKKLFDELLADLVVKPAGKPTLVPESDKRPELNSNANAAEDFKVEEDILG
jgi:hypothetical protein